MYANGVSHPRPDVAAVATISLYSQFLANGLLFTNVSMLTLSSANGA